MPESLCGVQALRVSWGLSKSEMGKWQLDVHFRGSGELLPDSSTPASRAGPALPSCSLGS